MTAAIKAFIAAQNAMEPARKQANNPAFKSKYADLSAVQEAVLPALNANGFGLQYLGGFDEHGEYQETVFLHESGERFFTRVRLIVAKNDMQGYGSAKTYARRYGLMDLAGIAPEDDDGNAAAKAPPVKRNVTADEFMELRDLIERSGSDEAKLLAFFKVDVLDNFPADKLDAARAMIRKKMDATNG